MGERRIGPWSVSALVVLVGVLLASAPLSAQAIPAGADTSCRATPVLADPVLHSDLARAQFGVDGTGVRVGIISDSFNTSDYAATDWAEDVTLGVLPGPGNPCGYEQPVEVLSDSEHPQSDEGRAMAQLVHGIAPGATILFSPANTSPDDQEYAASIDALVAAGADVIVDDIPGRNEPAFQEGVVEAAVKRATAAGVLYLAAAGNYSVVGSSGYPSAGHPIAGASSPQYRPMGCPEAVAAVYPGRAIDCHDADPGPGQDAENTVTMAAGGMALVSLSWAQPQDQASNTAFDLVALDTTGAPIGGVRGDAALAGGSGGFSNPAGEIAELRVTVVRLLDVGTPATPAIRWAMENAGSWPTAIALEYYQSVHGEVVGATLTGHAASASTVAVAAVNAHTRTVEPFSSLGSATQYFGLSAPGQTAPIWDPPIVTPGPTIAGVDRLPITFSLTPDGPRTFTGTSAAAPTAAAVAALALAIAPHTSPAELKTAMQRAASFDEILSPYSDDIEPMRYAGAGLVNAAELLQLLAVAPEPTDVPQPARLAATGNEHGVVHALAGLLLMTLGILGVRTVSRQRARQSR